MKRALGLCTSFGYRLIRDVMPVPWETRLNPILLKLANGEAINLDDSGIVHTPDGGIIVRILAYPDGSEVATMTGVASMLQPAGPEYSHGYGDAYIIRANEISSILNANAGIAYIGPITVDKPSSNIAMRGDILNIAPVWDELNYTGRDIVVQINDYGPYKAHDDLKEGAASIIVAEHGPMDSSYAHGTHVTGLVAGRGAMSGTISENMCLCRPRPEESGIIPQNNWGDQPGALSLIKGAAPGAKIAANSKFEGDLKEIFQMMPWGYDNGARISSNSWNTADGAYGDKAWQADKFTRDAVPGTGPTEIGNQEMLHVFSAGNNDFDTTEQVWVKNPATAQNVIAVGATENERCGFARNYDCTSWHLDSPEDCPPYGCYRCDTKSLRPPSANYIYERSGRGPSQSRVKPDIVAVGADVLAAQDPNTTTYWNFECLDCRAPCRDTQCLEGSGTICEYRYDKCDYGDTEIIAGNVFCVQDAQDDDHLGSCSKRTFGSPGVIDDYCKATDGSMIDFEPAKETWTGLNYMTISGTSMAAPIVAGAAAVFHEFFNARFGDAWHTRYPSPAMTKAAFINGAMDISAPNHPYPFLGNPECHLLADEDERGTDTNSDGKPDQWSDKYIMRFCMEQGWGRLNLKRSIVGPPGGEIYFIDQSPLRELSLDSGKDPDYEIQFDVTSSAIQLKITLVWTDAVGREVIQAGCEQCLINDLNLVVTAPDGASYWGNIFNNYDGPTDTDYNYSWRNNPLRIFDAVNNVENVIVKNPMIGT